MRERLSPRAKAGINLRLSDHVNLSLCLVAPARANHCPWLHITRPTHVKMAQAPNTDLISVCCIGHSRKQLEH